MAFSQSICERSDWSGMPEKMARVPGAPELNVRFTVNGSIRATERMS